MEHHVARRRALAVLAATPLALWSATEAAQARTVRAARGRRIPRGYASVDPRTATRVPLWQELGPDNPVFEGDPAFTSKTWTTVEESGYLLEQVTSMGTHTGTHISAPAHFVEGARHLSELSESWTLMPLAVLDLRARVAAHGGDFSLDVGDLTSWEKRHGRFPANGCVLLLTGFAERFGERSAERFGDGARGQGTVGAAHHPGSYFDPAPGLTGPAVAWLFDRRAVQAVGSDTFGPDASSDGDFSATLTALRRGGITVENVGAGLARMRPHGDWMSINGARPRFSGFQMGITGFTR